MKHQINIILVFASLSLISCKKIDSVYPSQNEALNSITKSNYKTNNTKHIQDNIKSTEKETKDIIEKKKVLKEEADKKSDYTMQYYFDKASRYLDAKPKTTSHKEELDKLPAIGK